MLTLKVFGKFYFVLYQSNILSALSEAEIEHQHIFQNDWSHNEICISYKIYA
jgi:hypothetical protein